MVRRLIVLLATCGVIALVAFIWSRLSDEGDGRLHRMESSLHNIVIICTLKPSFDATERSEILAEAKKWMDSGPDWYDKNDRTLLRIVEGFDVWDTPVAAMRLHDGSVCLQSNGPNRRDDHGKEDDLVRIIWSPGDWKK